MSSTNFAIPSNNASTLVSSVGYVAGNGFLHVAAGGGALFPALATGQYCRVTVIQAAFAYTPNATSSVYTIFNVSAVVGDVLTIAGTLEGTVDRNYVAGDVVEIRDTAGTFSDLQTAVVDNHAMNMAVYSQAGGL